MNRDTVLTDLRHLLADITQQPIDDITPATNLSEDLDVDSLTMLEVIVFLEKTYDIDAEEDLKRASADGRLSTVGALTDYVVAQGSLTPA